jgi:hypothetical protein
MTIFVSYSRKDEPVVKVLAQGFEAAHKEIWYDQDLMGGDSWWDTILKKIRSATVFIFVLSEDSLHSKPCLAELKYAEDLDRSVVPVRVGPVTSLRATPLAGRQVIEFRPENALSSFAIFAAVEEAGQNQRPLPDPLPAPPAIPYEYLQRLARQIESTELNQAQQFAVVDQLRRAITEETDDAVRHDVLDMLQNLMSKPWSTRRTEGEVRFILLANGTPEQSQAEPPQTAQPERKTDSEPPQVSTPESKIDREPPQESDKKPPQLNTPHQEYNQAQQDQPIPPDTPEPDGSYFIPEQLVAAYRHRQDGDSRSPAETGLDAKEQAASIVEPQTATRMTPTADSANHPPPAPFWPDVSTPPMPPYAPPRPAEESPRTERTAVAYATQPLPKQLFPTPQPPENWILSFIAVLFFFGFGAIALYFSFQVGQRYWAGNLAGATKASKLSHAWAIAGIVVGSLITTWLLIQR